MKPNYRNIVQKGDEIYLCVNGEWFFYNQTEPPLGAGAMGTVYLGRSCQTQERVAIKRVVDKYANVPSIRERAKLEASLLFRHRNLVEMIGYCELNPYNGPIFIVSRLVQGITLDEHVNTHLRNRKDAVKRICESLYPVMDALDYLHQKGIVHMDIKPANIMIEHGSNIRLMDLGIAYTPDSVSMTSPGLIGTPKYAAPEQIIEPGQVQLTVDKTTDIYELGVRCGRLQEFSLLHFSSLLFIGAGITNCSGAGLFVCYYCASAASFKTSFTSMYELGLKICSTDKLRFSEISDQSSIRKLAGVCPSLCSSIS